MLSEGKNLCKNLNSNLIQYLFQFFEGDEAMILSQINKKFKKNFLDFLLTHPDYEISFTISGKNDSDLPKYMNYIDKKIFHSIEETIRLNDLFLRIHLTKLIFKDLNFTIQTINDFKEKCKVNDVRKIFIQNCTFEFNIQQGYTYSSLNLMSYFSEEFKNLSCLMVTGKGSITFELNSEVFLKMGNLKHLSLNNIQLRDKSRLNFNDFMYLKNLESLDMRNSNIKRDFLIKLSLNINCFTNLRRLNFSNNDLNRREAGIIITSLGKSGKTIYIDLSENRIINSEDFKNIYSNLTINLSNQRKQKKEIYDVMVRMLFSRSGEVNETFKNFNENQIEKKMGMKNNGAILPLYIYPHPSKITFNKEELMRILRIENSIRLSRESQLLYDTHKYSSLEDHLLLDKQIILQALIITGYNPQQDESLKAYHVATAKYINDEEVRNEVVWMKYDKCKVGRFQPGDKAVINNIDLFSLLGTKTHFAEVLSSIKPNVIVCGSLS